MTTTMDPMKAPLGEVLDWLAERDGWAKQDVGVFQYGDANTVIYQWVHREGGRQPYTGSNPITIDRIAGMLPEGWFWRCIEQRPRGWNACSDRVKFQREVEQFVMEQPTELEARARVVAAVLMKEEK